MIFCYNSFHLCRDTRTQIDTFNFSTPVQQKKMGKRNFNILFTLMLLASIFHSVFMLWNLLPQLMSRSLLVFTLSSQFSIHNMVNSSPIQADLSVFLINQYALLYSKLGSHEKWSHLCDVVFTIQWDLTGHWMSYNLYYGIY